MTNQYEFLENLNEEEFASLAKKENIKSSFLGSYAWGKVAETRGWEPFYVGMKKNGQLVATALLLRKSLVMGYSYFYIPRGFTMDYSVEDDIKEFTKEIDTFCKKHKSIYFKIDPDIKLHTIDENADVVEGENNYKLVKFLENLGYKHRPLTYFFETEQPRFTFRIPLTGTIDEIETKYSRTTKSILKQTQKNEIEVVKGTRDDIKEFSRLMAMTEKRQDFYSHDEKFYETFYDILSKYNMVELYFGIVDIPKIVARIEKEMAELVSEKEKCEAIGNKKSLNKCKEYNNQITALQNQLKNMEDKPRERIVASAYLMTKYDDKAWTLYAGNDMDYGKFYANYAVYAEQIRDAKAEGRKYFDGFGATGKPNDDTKLNGLNDFKKKWGGEYLEFVGEFDYIENKPMYWAYKTLIPYYHKMINKRLREKVKNDN